MKRTIKKQFWFSRDEAQDLQKKAKKTCLSEAALVRLLLRGYEPKEKPDDRFYDAMREFSAIGNNIHQISVKANALGFIDTQKLNSELDLLEADILGTRFEKCVSCGTPIIKKGNRKKYCEKCAQRAYKAQQAEYARRKRAESKNRR